MRTLASVSKEDGVAFLALSRRVDALYGGVDDSADSPAELRLRVLALATISERARTDVLRSFAAHATNDEWAVVVRVLGDLSPILPRDVPDSLRELTTSRRDPAWLARVEAARLAFLRAKGGES